MGVMWVLAVLAASENSQLLSILLSAAVLLHAIFCLVGYCIINKRVRENLHRSFLRCMGRKVPLMEASLVVSSSSQNIGSNPRTPGGFLAGNYETSRRNIGISASSTTSRSTAKTSSSPYRSDGQLRHTSTSTSNYNSTSDVPSYLRGYEGRHREEKRRRHRKDSDSGSDTDGRSLDLASSHSSDDDESRAGRNSITHRNTGMTVAPSYLPNITEHVTASTPPELHVVQSPQLFPSVKQPIYAPRWSSQLPEAYLPSNNAGRWSQETTSDNEALSHKANSPNPLPNPDLTDTSYLHHKMNMPPSILENIQENYNYSTKNSDHGYDNGREEVYGQRKDYQDNFGEYNTNNYHQNSGVPYNEPDYGSTPIVNHMRPYQNPYIKEPIYEKKRPTYMGSQTNSPYISKEHIPADNMCSPRESHYSLKSVPMYDDSVHSVQTLLKNDHQQRIADYHSDRMSEGSDKNGYHFPYTAEEDHSSIHGIRNHHVNDINNPGVLSSSQMSSRHGSISGLQPLAPLTSITDTSE